MLVINPEGCFDCGVRECPTEAIFADAQLGLKGMEIRLDPVKHCA
jgi:NAD-dependent dihydropyrimidine dehydrogenase PreA subunit